MFLIVIIIFLVICQQDYLRFEGGKKNMRKEEKRETERRQRHGSGTNAESTEDRSQSSNVCVCVCVCVLCVCVPLCPHGDLNLRAY